MKCIIKVVLKIDGVLVNICKEFFCNSLHTNFSITHCSCRVPINRSKVALAIYQRIAERKLLDHPDDGVVNSCIPVRVILTQNFPYNSRSEERRVGKECRSRWAPNQERRRE